MQSQSEIRLTPQRQVILEELAKVKTHPTANEVYDMVRKRLPRIGLGTVYRNLELMADNGMILKLEVGGSQKRFDATTNLHYHIRCTCCGKVDDMLQIPAITRWLVIILNFPVFAQPAAQPRRRQSPIESSSSREQKKEGRRAPLLFYFKQSDRVLNLSR
jgi:Fe2+ or Zn2+ uptake regulation protein